MQRVGVAVVLSTLVLGGCSLFVSLDDLTSDAGDGSEAGTDASLDATSDGAIGSDGGKLDAGSEGGSDGGPSTTELCKTHKHCWTFDDAGTVPSDLSTTGTMAIQSGGKSPPNDLLVTADSASSGFNGNVFYQTSMSTLQEAHVYASLFFQNDPADATRILPAYYLRLGLYAAADADRCEFYLRIGYPGADVDHRSAMLVLPHAMTTTQTIPVPMTGVPNQWNDVVFETFKDGSGLHLRATINGVTGPTWDDTGNVCFSGGDAYFYAGASEVDVNETVRVDDLSFDVK